MGSRALRPLNRKVLVEMNLFRKPLFHLDPENSRASRLSIAGGALKLLSLLMLAAAVLGTLALLAAVIQLTVSAGFAMALHLLLDELEELPALLFLLWVFFAACWFAAGVLHAKSGLLSQAGRPKEPAARPVSPPAPRDGSL